MIRLKKLILEANIVPRINVLFVGDHQTKNNWSYAKQLIDQGTISGRIVGWTNATTSQLYRMVKYNLTKRYDVVVIMGGDSDAKSKDPATSQGNLERTYSLAKKYGAKVIAISNPSKMYLTPGDKNYSDTLYPSNDIIADWINSQTISDETIDANSFGESAFSNDNYRLNPSANREIASQVKAAIQSFNITPRNKNIDITDKTLRLGSTGAAVSKLHDDLVTLNYEISQSEINQNTYGDTTLKAVNDIQKRSNISETGIVDQNTLNAIEDLKSNVTDTDDTDTDTDFNYTIKRNRTNADYINKYAAIAVEQMKRYDIPASIILAQGILESGNGNSGLAVQANNHFGIKGSYNGKTYCTGTSEYENGYITKRACFRKYPTVDDSYEDHSKLLMGSRYQQKVKEMATGPTDYVGWAKALQAAGYATSPTYAKKIIGVIESLGLQEYDIDGAPNKKITNVSTSSLPLKINSPYGERDDGMHLGIDYYALSGTTLTALKPGKVTRADNRDRRGYGNMIEIKHDDGTVTRYGHMRTMNVSKGDRIEAGQILGETGGGAGDPGRGNSEGAHLHWEYVVGGKRLDGESVAAEYFALS